MVIVCFIYFDNSLFAGFYFWPLYGYIPNAKTFLFSNVWMKNPNFKSEKILKKKLSFCRVNCVLKCLFICSRSHFYRLLAYQSCYYDVNSKYCHCIIRTQGVVPSNDQHIGPGLLLCFNR